MLRFWVGGYTPFSAIPCSFVNEFACDKPHYPFELPEGWEWCKLEDIVSFGGGKTPSMSVRQYWENGTNLWVTSKDMKKERINDSLMKITDAALEGMNIYEKGTILVVTRSGILKHTLPLAILVKKATVNQDLKTISPYMLSLSEYLYFAIKANEKEILANYHKDGTTVDSIDFDKFRCLPIALPPMYEQERIVKCIKYWFSLIESIEENRDKLQEVIKQTKSKILDLAIHGKLVPQDPSDEPASELLERINPKAEITCDNPQYENLPNGWCECTLGSLFLFIRNGINIRQDKSKIGYPITRIETISSEFIDRSRMGYAAITEENYSDYYLQKNDILMSHINSPIHVGKCALCDIKAGEKIIHGMNLLCLRPYPDIEAKFILIVFKSPYFKNEIRPFIKNAVNQASINIRNLSSVHLYLPPVSEQHRIVAKIEELFTQLDKIEVSL